MDCEKTGGSGSGGNGGGWMWGCEDVRINGITSFGRRVDVGDVFDLVRKLRGLSQHQPSFEEGIKD